MGFLRWPSKLNSCKLSMKFISRLTMSAWLSICGCGYQGEQSFMAGKSNVFERDQEMVGKEVAGIMKGRISPDKLSNAKVAISNRLNGPVIYLTWKNAILCIGLDQSGKKDGSMLRLVGRFPGILIEPDEHDVKTYESWVITEWEVTYLDERPYY